MLGHPCGRLSSRDYYGIDFQEFIPYILRREPQVKGCRVRKLLLYYVSFNTHITYKEEVMVATVEAIEQRGHVPPKPPPAPPKKD
jgi:hypothetical protein